ARRQCRVSRSRASVGTWSVRRTRRAAHPRDHADRTGAGHDVHWPADPGIHQSLDGENGLRMSKPPIAAWQARAGKLIGEPPGPIPAVQDLVNAWEFEDVAKRRLGELPFAEIAGSERAAFERITFRPKLMVDTRQIDLSAQVLGQTLFMPILIGPLANQKRF